MKKILITGANSYIGTSFEKYIMEFSDYKIDTLDMRNPLWKESDFSRYDVVFHVAGIAHIKEKKENKDLYYKVNRDLAIETAKKAKEMGVKQFLFMSSMSVYGLNCCDELINNKTDTNPKTNYGRSKLEAENEIKKLIDEDFIVTIIRPPMVYGINSPGNLTKLVKLVKKLHVFPTIKNERSYLSIDNLVKHIKLYIDNRTNGVVLPQNDSYLCTYYFIKKLLTEEGISVIYISAFNPFIRFLIGKVELISKIFGDLKYE